MDTILTLQFDTVTGSAFLNGDTYTYDYMFPAGTEIVFLEAYVSSFSSLSDGPIQGMPNVGTISNGYQYMGTRNYTPSVTSIRFDSPFVPVQSVVLGYEGPQFISVSTVPVPGTCAIPEPDIMILIGLLVIGFFFARKKPKK